ncbi:MAG: 4Fe-4S dicluster domain-containing protein [Candidatus Omnitrophota bacterium]
MPMIKIKRDRCKGCKLCVIHCPKSCIEMETSLNKKGIHPAIFLEDKKCTGCTFCAIVCPDLCIEVK